MAQLISINKNIKQKSAWLMVAISILAGGFMTFIPSAQAINQPNVKTATNDSQQIRTLTTNFYKSYLRYLEQDDDNGPQISMVQFLQRSGAFDSKFITKIDKFVKESLAEVGFVEVNPIIWAQDVPLDIRVSQPSIHGNQATVMVYSLWSDTDKQVLLVKLTKSNKGWKIYDIVDGGMI